MFLGYCKCGRPLVQDGSWGSPPVAIIKCSGCRKYQEHCNCKDK